MQTNKHMELLEIDEAEGWHSCKSTVHLLDKWSAFRLAQENQTRLATVYIQCQYVLS